MTTCKSFPDPLKAVALRQRLLSLFRQRVNRLKELADTYKTESVPLAIGAGVVFLIQQGGTSFDVFMKKGSALYWNSASNWDVSEQAIFVQCYGEIMDSYADDVNRAYETAESANLWSE